MKERILSEWTVVRFIYLILGIGLMVQAYMEQQWMGIAIGGYFASMAVFNFGCAAGACFNTNAFQKPVEKLDTDAQNPEFEEVKAVNKS